jgi:hypothetical protein
MDLLLLFTFNIVGFLLGSSAIKSSRVKVSMVYIIDGFVLIVEISYLEATVVSSFWDFWGVK